MKFDASSRRQSSAPKRRRMAFEPLDRRHLLAAMPLVTEFTAAGDGVSVIADTTDTNPSGPASSSSPGSAGEADNANQSQEILVADRLSNSVYRYSTSGSFLGILVDHDDTHLNQPTGIQLSPDASKLYVSSSQTNSVVIYDYDYVSATYSQTITQNLTFPNSILFNAAGTKFYVANFAFNIVDDVPVPVGVAQFNANGTSAGPNIVGGSILQATGLEWASDNELLVGGFGGLVAKSTLGVSVLTDYITSPPILSGASGVLRIGTDLYVSALFVPAIYKFDITGAPAVVNSFTINSLAFPQGVIAAPDGNGLLVGVLGTIAGTGNISRIGFNGALDPISVFAPNGDGTNGFQEATAMVVVPEPASVTQVTGRRLFYNNSIWDNPGYGFTNASAIATDKTAYIPTGSNTSTFASMSSYTKGINGIMVELTGLHGTLTASDFSVKVSGQLGAVNNSPATWAAAPSFSVTLVPDTPSVGTDRYELTWADGDIVDRYVYVKVKGNDTAGGNDTNTGLATSDGFFFGSYVGDVGTPEPYPYVDATDQSQVRANQGPNAALPNNPYDFNRDGSVDNSDQNVARGNQGFMTYLVIPSAGPFAPQAPSGGDPSGSAVASALAAGGESWVAAPVVSARTDEAAGQPSDRGSIRRFWQHLGTVSDPRASALLGSFGEAGETAAIDEWLEGVLRLKR
jgi:hypothetical protein